jgi:hypothetical protein
VPYDSAHLYLTAHWTDNREANEGGQVGIRFRTNATAVTQAMVDAAKPAWQTFWLSAGALIPFSYKLSFLRLALIGTDGHYAPGTFSFDGVFAGGVNSANSAVTHPMQVASVATFLSSSPRGQASHGRIYLPPLGAGCGTDGRWTAAQVNARAAAVATLVTSLNTALAATPGGANAISAIFSKGTSKGAGPASQNIVGVKIGTRPDVQRRRAKGQAEVYGTTSAITN